MSSLSMIVCTLPWASRNWLSTIPGWHSSTNRTICTGRLGMFVQIIAHFVSSRSVMCSQLATEATLVIQVHHPFGCKTEVSSKSLESVRPQKRNSVACIDYALRGCTDRVRTEQAAADCLA